MITERRRDGMPGWVMGLTAVTLGLIGTWGVAGALGQGGGLAWFAAVVGVLGALVVLFGFFIVEPNQARVLQLFGQYIGSARTPGLRWANPLVRRRSVSLRGRTHETPTLKVTDPEGNPIEVGAAVVWRVMDSAAAVFAVEDYEAHVEAECESALRAVAMRLPRGARQATGLALTGDTAADVGERLREEASKRLGPAGIHITEARIAHLAYAPEIAAAMLQAGAALAARQRIVDGAVGMVGRALRGLEEQRVVELDAQQKAALAANLLVVLCGDQPARPGK